MTTSTSHPADHRRRADASERVGRLFRILTALSTRSPGRPLGRDTLADVCECSVRTVQRDVDLLRSSGVPIDYHAARHTYTLTEAGWAYPLTSLTGEDALALALARSLLGRPGVPYQEPILRALDKTAAGLTPELRALLDGAVQVLRAGGTDRDYPAAPWPELVAAAHQCRTVEILYRSRSGGGEPTWRFVDPYLIDAREGRYWELHGWCHRRERISTFALDQVRGLRQTGQTFQRREELWAAFAGADGVVGGLRGGQPVAVDVEFAAEVAAYALDHTWPVGLAVAAQPDGSARLTGTAQGVAGLVPTVLSWRRHARVCGGPELLEAITAEVQALAALYAQAT